jgi:hypothetical protein
MYRFFPIMEQIGRNRFGNMNVILYRKLYLSRNWGSNCFSQLKHSVVGVESRLVLNIQNHPFVSSGRAYWINDNELCMGYQLRTNPQVFRPIFSSKRQRLLNVVHTDLIHPSNFWRTVRMRYWQNLCLLKQLPLECVDCIVRFIYK